MYGSSIGLVLETEMKSEAIIEIRLLITQQAAGRGRRETSLLARPAPADD
jgi:hypothetical protein